MKWFYQFGFIFAITFFSTFGYPKNDFNADFKSEIPLLSDWGIGILNYSYGTLYQNMIAASGTRFGEWLFNTADNRFGPVEDYDGDGAAEFLVTSPWGIGFLELSSSTLTCPMLAPNGTRFDGWLLNTADNHFDVVGNFDGVYGKEILVTSPWGIGILKVSGSTISCLTLIPNGTRIGGWLLNTADNHFGPVGDFDGDGSQEIVVTSPWGMGIIELSGNTFQCVTMAPNGSALGEWSLNTDNNRFGPTGDFDSDGSDEMLVTNPDGLCIMKLSGGSIASVVKASNGTWIDGWNLNTGDNSFGPVGKFDGGSKDKIVVNSPWGIGMFELTGTTLSAPMTAANGSSYNGWRLNTADNRINIAGDFDQDGQDELLVTSPWGIGILEKAQSTITALMLAPNGTRFDGWLLNTADNDAEVGNWQAKCLIVYHNDWSWTVNDLAGKLLSRGYEVFVTDTASVGFARLNALAVQMKKGDRLFVYLAGHGSNPRSGFQDTARATSLNHFVQFNWGDLYVSQTAPVFTRLANAGVDLTVLDGSCNGGESVYYAMGEKYCMTSTVGFMAPGLTGFPNMGDVLAYEHNPSTFGFWTGPHLMGSLLNGIIVKGVPLRPGQRLYRNDNNDFNKQSILARLILDMPNWFDGGGYFMMVNYSKLYQVIYPDLFDDLSAAEQAKYTHPGDEFIEAIETSYNNAKPYFDKLMEYMDNSSLVSQGEPVYQAGLINAWRTLACDMTWDPVTEPAKHASEMYNLSAEQFMGANGFTTIIERIKANLSIMQYCYTRHAALLRRINTLAGTGRTTRRRFIRLAENRSLSLMPETPEQLVRYNVAMERWNRSMLTLNNRVMPLGATSSHNDETSGNEAAGQKAVDRYIKAYSLALESDKRTLDTGTDLQDLIDEFKAVSVMSTGCTARISMLFSIVEDVFNALLSNGQTYPGDVNLY